jgi:ADP-ribose pyrophosphatase YjhB (NUDIX family)
MPINPKKYWYDIVLPTMRGDNPPLVPQGVVLHDNKVLLVKRDNPLLWELPGGGVPPGECTEAAVIREIQEETGVSVVIVELLGWYERTGFRAHLSPVYVCRPTGGSLRPQLGETVAVRYFSLQALPRGIFPWYRPILKQDILSPVPRPLRCAQHLGMWTVFQCLALDLFCRLGLLE